MSFLQDLIEEHNALTKRIEILNQLILEYRKPVVGNAWSQTQDDLIRHHWAKGTPAKAIAKLLFRRTERAVVERARQLGLMPQKDVKFLETWTEEQKEELFRMKATGSTWAAIADETERSVTHCLRFWKLYKGENAE